MDFFSEVLFVGLLPLVVAATAAFALRHVRAPAPVCCGTGVALGYVAGQLLLAGRSGVARAFQSLIQPREAQEWLPHAVFFALGITILASHAPRHWRQAVIGTAAVLVIAVPARLLAGPVAQQWSALEKIAHLALLGATLALVWLLLATARDDELPRGRQMLLVVASVGTAIITTLSGSFTLGRLCGVVAAAVTGSALVSPRGIEGAAGVVAVSLGGLMILGIHYAKLHPASAALVLLSILAAAGRLPEASSARPPWQQAAFRAVLCLASLAIALAMSLARTD